MTNTFDTSSYHPEAVEWAEMLDCQPGSQSWFMAVNHFMDDMPLPLIQEWQEQRKAAGK